VGGALLQPPTPFEERGEGSAQCSDIGKLDFSGLETEGNEIVSRTPATPSRVNTLSTIEAIIHPFLHITHGRRVWTCAGIKSTYIEEVGRTLRGERDEFRGNVNQIKREARDLWSLVLRGEGKNKSALNFLEERTRKKGP